MSFSNRLTSFFLIIVALPMLVTTVLFVRIGGQLNGERADAKLSQALTTMVNLYDRQRDEKRADAEELGDSRALAEAWGKGSAQLRHYLRGYLTIYPSITALDPKGHQLWHIGDQEEGLAVISLKAPAGSAVRVVELATVVPQEFLDEASQLTTHDLYLSEPDGHVVATTTPLPGDLPPPDGTSTIDGTDYRIRHVMIDSNVGRLRLAMMDSQEPDTNFGGQLVVLGILLVIALVLGYVLRRSMQHQLNSMVEAAKRLGDGDFDTEVPATGNDEMSRLAVEFNRMGDRLRSHIQKQQESLYRFGETIASTLDREGLLQATLSTAMDACGARYGQVIVPDDADLLVENGEAEAEICREIREQASAACLYHNPERSEHSGWFTIGYPILSPDSGSVLAVLSIARRRHAFESADLERLAYLARQASVSLENVSLHAVVSRQAITDPLTGLHNRRSFDNLAEKEALRVGRFGHSLSLLMLDIDDFKTVNDTYGHQVGDQVLKAISSHLQMESRAVDEPARFGGEEFAVLCPETEAEEAMLLAERLLAAIGRESIETDAGPLNVTVSIGVASLPGDAEEVVDLIAAADGALYEAKRSGKARVVRFAPKTKA